AAILDPYIAMEKLFRSFPSYYYSLWQGMKAGDNSYSLYNIQGVLEKTIILNTASPFSRESREELGRLMGLSQAESEILLIGPEIDEIAYKFLESGDTRTLDSALLMLSLPNNEYTDATINMFLFLLEQTPSVKEYLYSAAAINETMDIRLSNLINY
nr:hypothetical protein [Spirochaetaceae bacterium]